MPSADERLSAIHEHGAPLSLAIASALVSTLGAAELGRARSAAARVLRLPWPPHDGQGPRIPPVFQFAALSALVLLVAGAAEAWLLGRQIEAQMVEHATELASAEVRGAVREGISAADLDRPLTGERYEALRTLLRSSVLSGRVHRVKVWNARGQIVYSDDRSQVGVTYDNDEVRTVVRERTTVVELGRPHGENVAEQGLGRLIEIYVPLVPRDSDEVLGAYEIYLSDAPIAREVERAGLAIWIATGASIATLWLALFGVFLRASHAVRRGEAERQRAAALHAQVRRDPLTGLANRVALEERLQSELGAVAADRPLALLVIDLDNLREVNDGLGHEAGDALLRQVARRSVDAVRKTDLVARLGGDVFAAVLPGMDARGAAAVAAKLLEGLEAPVTIEGEEIATSASIGVAVTRSTVDASAPLRDAEAAMYMAKRLGGGTHAVWEPSGGADADPWIHLANELRDGIDADELRVEYQPIVRLATAAPAGAEVLVRWQHPRLGILPPGEFVPLAERAGLTRALTGWVIGAVCRDLDRWGLTSLPVWVNVSLRDVFDVGLRTRAVACVGHGHRIGLELSERSLRPRESPRLISTLGRLRDAGVRIAIDDFGVGTWSIADLRQVPVDVLKIDISLVTEMASNATIAALVEAIVGLAQSLGREVIAEGIEDASVVERLRSAGCDLGQGFLIARPMSAEALAAWPSQRSSVRPPSEPSV